MKIEKADTANENNSDMDLTNVSECLSPETNINMADGTYKQLKYIKVGDIIKGNNKDVTVKRVM